MKLVRFLIAFLPALCASAQKLETQSPDPKKVTRVETVPDHLTVIEVGSPVTMVAVGNQGAFTVERRENKVFVKPVEPGARTNLFVWTAAGRFAYELVPAANVGQMHFAIDQISTPVAATDPATMEPAPRISSLPSDMLTNADPILPAHEQEMQGRVKIALRDMYRQGDLLYLRYAVINHSAYEYLPVRPAAWRLNGVRAEQSLIPLANRQLGERLGGSLKAASSTRLAVRDASAPAKIPAGGSGLGWVVLEEAAPANQQSVLRLDFAADSNGSVTAMLVVPGRSDRAEVADARAAGK
jgi:hypothetical protein